MSGRQSERVDLPERWFAVNARAKGISPDILAAIE
jgi:hypothetical protein